MQKTWPAPRYTEPLENYKRHHYQNDIWIIRSPKMNRRVQLDSDLEYLNEVETEGTPEVVALCVHPVRAEARIDEKDHTSVIDMYKVYKCGDEEFNEVKYEKDLKTEQTELQMAVQISYSNRVNVHHTVVTEKYLETKEMKIRNWKRIIAILNLGRELHLEKEMTLTKKQLCDRGPLSLEQVIRLLELEDWIIEQAVCRLLQSGDIDANLDKEDFCYTTILTAQNV